MKRKFIWGTLALLLSISLSGCSQVHFGKDAVTIGEIKTVKKKSAPKKPKPVKKVKVQSSSSKKKSVKKVVTKWNKKKTKKLQKLLNTWSKKSGQEYDFYNHGQKQLKTKKGATYPDVFKQRRFVLNKKTIKLGYSPLGVNKYQYNVLAIANDNFKSWHNTYLFCIKAGKPLILLDQSKNTNPIMVRVVKDKQLNQGFKRIYEN